MNAPDQTYTILLIEDEEDDQFVARHYLGRMDPSVDILSAYDGIEAIELLQARRDRLPDLILLDINMPRMNGHEFLEAWFVENGAEVPIVVMLTSSDQKEDKERALAYENVRDFFIKPMMKETVTRLQQIMAQQRAEHDADDAP